MSAQAAAAESPDTVMLHGQAVSEIVRLTRCVPAKEVISSNQRNGSPKLPSQNQSPEIS